MPIALDTNIVVYAFDQDEGTKYERARSIVESAARTPLRLPLQVVNESFSVLIGRRGWSKTDARAALEALVKFIPVVHGTFDDALPAMLLCDRHSIAYWYALIVATAAGGGCGSLLTEDMQDGRAFDATETLRQIRVVNPFLEANHLFLETVGVRV